jgi:prepilin-type N-terminal cleavage/methylation domain-containing protein
MKNSYRVNSLALLNWASSHPLSANAGFTMLEVLCVAAIVGILMTIAAPGWLGFANSRSLNAAQDQAYQAIVQAQNEAKARHIQWQVSFQTSGTTVQWATSSTTTVPTTWQSLPDGVKISASPDTTLSQSSGVYSLQFDSQGNVNGQLGKLTLMSLNGGSSKRCVIVSTLLGAFRKAQNTDCN